MQGIGLHNLTDGKAEDDRARIARRVGEALQGLEHPQQAHSTAIRGHV